MASKLPPPPEPLVERNAFRAGQERAYPPPAPFADVRPRLPVPVLPDDPAYERLYWSAWERLWACLCPPAPRSRLVGPYLQPAAVGSIEIGAAAFAAQLSGYAPGTTALIDILDNFYARQHDDGFICRALDPADGDDRHLPYEPDSTGPALLAWAEWRRFRLTGDASRIAAVLPPLLAYHRWCRANRTWPNGLYWATGHSSGLVNQPRVPGGRHHHAHWSWVDATAQAALDAALLERMAVLLGEQTLADEVSIERRALMQTFNDTFWNEELGFYQDVGPDGRFSPVKSIAAYWALLDGQLIPKTRLTPFIQHLRDTWSFRTPTVLPSLAADDEAYNARTGNGWRGGVWPALTYMVLRGLGLNEQHGLAHKLALTHIDAVSQLYETTGHLWSHYAPEDLGPGEPAEEDAAGQTAAAFIAMLLENVIGVWVDWPLRQVTWRRHLERPHYGVRGLPLGDEGTLDLLSDGATVRLRSDAPLTLILHNGSEVIQSAVPAGAFTISLD
ncbi:MAG: hypothetical protein IPH95_03050 [Candidatus Promineofilum sp.]|nr:hypothetical protein [Promineifilum sp.]